VEDSGEVKSTTKKAHQTHAWRGYAFGPWSGSNKVKQDKVTLRGIEVKASSSTPNAVQKAINRFTTTIFTLTCDDQSERRHKGASVRNSKLAP
jgi:hypothetical protein